MKKGIIAILMIVSICLNKSIKATIIECPLDLAGEYDITESRAIYFDLGYVFTDISHVYMDWQGEINACLAEDIRNPGILFPLSVALSAWFEEDPIIGYAAVEGGYDYPNPTKFDVKSEGHLFWDYTWAGFYDGKGKVSIGYSAPGGSFWLNIVETNPIVLDSVKIVVDGNIVPEPMAIYLLATGMLGLRLRRRNN